MGAVIFALIWVPILFLCRIGVDLFIHYDNHKKYQKELEQQRILWAERVGQRRKRIWLKSKKVVESRWKREWLLLE